VLAALNAQADQIIHSLSTESVAATVTNLAGIGAAMWVAMYAALKIGFEREDRRIGRSDVIVLSVVLALSFLPLSYAAQAALLLCGLYLLLTSAPGSASRRLSFVLLALTGPLIWGRLLLHVFGNPILALDARIVGTLIGTPIEGNVIQFVNDSRHYLIATPCSSVHNMSLAIVLWTTAAALLNIRVDRLYVMIGAAMVAWMFALNIARLAAIGLFPRNFEFLHLGAGAALFGWAGLIGAGLLAGMGVIGAANRQR
jgi:hypothetical protein